MHWSTFIAVVFTSLFFQRCSEQPPSYESQFRDCIWIHFPPGHPFDGVETLRVKIDRILREKEIGYWSGVLGVDGDIDYIELETDFDMIDEHRLVQSFFDKGYLPQNVKVDYLPKSHDPGEKSRQSANEA